MDVENEGLSTTCSETLPVQVAVWGEVTERQTTQTALQRQVSLWNTGNDMLVTTLTETRNILH